MSTAKKPAFTLDLTSSSVAKKPNKGVTLTIGQTEPKAEPAEPANTPKTARASAKAAAIASVKASAEAAAKRAANPAPIQVKPEPSDEIEPDIADGLSFIKPMKPVVAETTAPPAPVSTAPLTFQAVAEVAPESEDEVVHALVSNTAARIQHRASIIATFAALNGTAVPVRDVSEFLWTYSPGDVDIKSLARAVDHTGIRHKISNNVEIAPDIWPALTMMTNGQCVLVLSQVGNVLTIFDTTVTDNRVEVPVAEFEPVFSGTILTGRAPLKDMVARNIPQLESEHWFWGEFPKYKRQVAEIMVGSLVANLLAVAVALFSLQVYDRVIPHQSQATLWVLTMGVALAIMLEGALKIARARLTDAAGRQIELSVQKNLMQRLVGMRSDKRPLPPSGLFAAMREFGSVREFFTSSTLSTLADVPFVAVFLLLIASIAGPIVWAIVLGAILMLVPAYFMQKRMIELTRQTQGANAKAGRLLHEVVTELDTLKTQRGEERMLQNWQELIELSSHTNAEQRRLSNGLTYWSQAVQQGTYIAAVVLGTFMVFAGEFTVGTIIATGILTSRTLAPLTQLASTMARWGNVKTALEGLDAIALAPQEKEAERSYIRRENIDGEFELHEISFRYEDDGAPTLDVPAIKIPAGQRVAILGVNGSGKSTLLKVLSGLYAPDKGRVLLDGTEMSQIDPRDMRRNIGYLSQEIRLLTGSLRDNLNQTMLERDDDRLMKALDFSGLGPFVRGHHKGLDMEIQDGGLGLSVGQRQSIGWARLWLQDPRIVLLDEPTAALDQALEKSLVASLDTWLKGRTTIIATHRLPILSLTDRTLILQAGRLMVDGPREQVLSHLSAKGEV